MMWDFAGFEYSNIIKLYSKTQIHFKEKILSFDFPAAGPDDAASCFGPSALGQKINRKDKDDGSNTVGFVRFCRDAGGGSIEGARGSGNGRSAELSE